MNHSMKHPFFTSLICCCVAALNGQAVLPSYDTKTTENINKMQKSLAEDLSRKAICTNHEGTKKFQEKVEKSQYTNYWSGWQYSGSTPNMPLYLTVDYLDSAKMYAVHEDKSLVSKLTPREWQALQEAERRLQTLGVTGMSDFDKVLTIHDDLLEQVEYDITKFTATDMLLKDKGRCDSYSRVMQLMLQMAGVPTMRIVGLGKNQAHAWNMVKVDGQWFHVDATWDDPKMRKGESILRHNYFLLTDTEISKDHKWEKGVYPVSSSEKAYYFKKIKAYFSEYEQFWKEVKKAFNDGDAGYEGYLTCYKNDKTFEKEIETFAKANPGVTICNWYGPDDKEGAVYLSFRGKKSRGKAKKSKHEYPVETPESAKDWLGPDLLKRLYENLGNPEALKQEATKAIKQAIPGGSGRPAPSFFF